VVSSDRTAVVLTFDEAVLAAGGGAFDSTQFTYRPDCQVTTAAVNGHGCPDG
jgi:hypothetical protein